MLRRFQQAIFVQFAQILRNSFSDLWEGESDGDPSPTPLQNQIKSNRTTSASKMIIRPSEWLMQQSALCLQIFVSSSLRILSADIRLFIHLFVFSWLSWLRCVSCEMRNVELTWFSDVLQKVVTTTQASFSKSICNSFSIQFILCFLVSWFPFPPALVTITLISIHSHHFYHTFTCCTLLIMLWITLQVVLNWIFLLEMPCSGM